VRSHHEKDASDDDIFGGDNCGGGEGEEGGHANDDIFGSDDDKDGGVEDNGGGQASDDIFREFDDEDSGVEYSSVNGGDEEGGPQKGLAYDAEEKNEVRSRVFKQTDNVDAIIEIGQEGNA
jgi:hypothetical protein